MRLSADSTPSRAQLRRGRNPGVVKPPTVLGKKFTFEELSFVTNLFRVRSTISPSDVADWTPGTRDTRASQARKFQKQLQAESVELPDEEYFLREEFLPLVHSLGMEPLRQKLLNKRFGSHTTPTPLLPKPSSISETAVCTEDVTCRQVHNNAECLELDIFSAMGSPENLDLPPTPEICASQLSSPIPPLPSFSVGCHNVSTYDTSIDGRMEKKTTKVPFRVALSAWAVMCDIPRVHIDLFLQFFHTFNIVVDKDDLPRTAKTLLQNRRFKEMRKAVTIRSVYRKTPVLKRFAKAGPKRALPVRLPLHGKREQLRRNGKLMGYMVYMGLLNGLMGHSPGKILYTVYVVAERGRGPFFFIRTSTIRTPIDRRAYGCERGKSYALQSRKQ